MTSMMWSDLHVGQRFRSTSRTIGEAEVSGFAGLTGDFSELHTSDVFAQATPYGRRVAHGLLGLSVAHGLMWARSGQFRDSAIAFLGIREWSFTGPIYLGDTIHVEYEVAELRVSRSNPDRGIATFSVEVKNQDGEVVQRGTKALLMSISGIGDGPVGETGTSP